MISDVVHWTLLLLGLVACDRDRPPAAHTTSWWCWSESVCFAERTECEAVGRKIETRPSCVARERAYCQRGCEPGLHGAAPSCGPRCAIDKAACELLGKSGTCREELPPEHPALFDYSTPGFWCYELTGPPPASWCTKEKAECDFILDDTLSKMGLARDALGSAASAGCTRPTRPVYCWSRRVEGKLAFVCTTSREFCELTQAGAPGIAKAAGQPLVDVTGCAPWAYD